MLTIIVQFFNKKFFLSNFQYNETRTNAVKLQGIKKHQCIIKVVHMTCDILQVFYDNLCAEQI